MAKDYIRKVSGSLIGTVDTEPNGDKTVRDVSGRLLGRYIRSRNVTTDVSGRTVAQGDCAVVFLFCDISRIM